MMVYLDFAFVSKQAFGLNKCKQIMESKFLMEISNFLKYELQKFSKVFEMAWMQGFGCNIKFDTMVLGILSTKGQDKLDCGGCGIVG